MYDGVNGVLDGDHGIDRLVRDVDVKSLAERFDDLDDRQRVDPQILIEPRRWDNLLRLTTDHLNDDAGELFVDSGRGRHR